MSVRWVSGPNPAGTGVMNDATSLTLTKSISPTTLPPTVLIPASSTIAPGFTISAVIIAGRPTLTTRISALRVILARSCVWEWQMVTVASRLISTSAIGLPPMLLRPTIAAFRPATGISASSRKVTGSHISGIGVERMSIVQNLIAISCHMYCQLMGKGHGTGNHVHAISNDRRPVFGTCTSTARVGERIVLFVVQNHSFGIGEHCYHIHADFDLRRVNKWSVISTLHIPCLSRHWGRSALSHSRCWRTIAHRRLVIPHVRTIVVICTGHGIVCASTNGVGSRATGCNE